MKVESKSVASKAKPEANPKPKAEAKPEGTSKSEATKQAAVGVKDVKADSKEAAPKATSSTDDATKATRLLDRQVKYHDKQAQVHTEAAQSHTEIAASHRAKSAELTAKLDGADGADGAASASAPASTLEARQPKSADENPSPTQSDPNQSPTQKDSNVGNSVAELVQKPTQQLPFAMSSSTRIRIGDKNESVREVQEAMVAAGEKIEVDGVFGPKTERAVRRYQESRNLGIDGIVGPETGGAIASNAPKVKEPSAASEAPAVSTSVKNSSTKGLSGTARQYLEKANQAGLRLVSGHRPGGPSWSDHGSGHAIDVANVPGGSRTGSAEMRAYADSMRGKPGVKYVIYMDQKASAVDNWKWRPYVHPSGNTKDNTLAHRDHVHVSVK